jgi:hypothetical protein
MEEAIAPDGTQDPCVLALRVARSLALPGGSLLDVRMYLVQHFLRLLLELLQVTASPQQLLHAGTANSS